jgi:hypothetical protein
MTSINGWREYDEKRGIHNDEYRPDLPRGSW